MSISIYGNLFVASITRPPMFINGIIPIMNKALCLLNAHAQTDGPNHFYERMKEEFLPFGIELEKKTNDEILCLIDSEGHISSGLPNYQFVLYLDKDLYTSFLLEKFGFRLFNSANAIRLCDDKMLTHLTLSDQGIPMPKTISGPLNYAPSISASFLDGIRKELSFPLVAKDNFGSLGKNVYLIRSEEELRQFEISHAQKPRLYQEFISSSKGFDFRVIVIGGRVVAAMKRENAHDWRSNIAQKGTGYAVPLPNSYAEIAKKAAKIIGLDYCGIDLLEGPDKEPILCEVNSNAFLRGIESVSGVNVAKAYAEHIVASLRR